MFHVEQKTAKMKKLLSNGKTNAKLAKSVTKSFILYMSPYTDNSKGINVCPNASKGCAAACLYTAGMGKFSNVQKARKAKTEFWIEDKKAFYTMLAKEIQTKVKTARRKNEKIAFRLNGTSDLDHIKMLKVFAGLDISDLADAAIFYDYTKVPKRALKYRDHENYDVTFSRSEDNELTAISLLSEGVNVAVVFSSDELPETWKGFKVIDGDESDERFKDESGVVVGLKAKGDAKKDTTGFVVQL